MTNQRSYPDILLGFGTGSQTIANYGCYMISIYDELKKRGIINYSVAQWNDFLKKRSVYTPANPVLLSSTTLAAQCPEIFSYGANEPWSDARVIETINTKRSEYIVIGEVSAKGIGGSGQHFVKMDKIDVSTGKVTMSYIDDPWGGLEDQKVTNRYNAFGNILSLRVFKLKQGGSMPDTTLYTYLGVTNDTEAKARIREHLGERDGKCDWGNEDGDKGGFLGSSRRDVKRLDAEKNALQQQVNDFPAQLETAKTESYKKGFSDGQASNPTPPSTDPTQPLPPVDMNKYVDNGVSVETTEGNTKTIINYKKVA